MTAVVLSLRRQRVEAQEEEEEEEEGERRPLRYLWRPLLQADHPSLQGCLQEVCRS